MCVCEFVFFFFAFCVLFYFICLLFLLFSLIWTSFDVGLLLLLGWLVYLFVFVVDHDKTRRQRPLLLDISKRKRARNLASGTESNSYVLYAREFSSLKVFIYVIHMNVCRSHTHKFSPLLVFFFFSFRSVFRPRRRLRRCLFYTSITLVFVDVVVGAILLSNSALYKSYTTPSMHRVVGGSFVCICWGSLLKWISACLCMCPLPFCLFFGFVSFLS